MFGFACSFGTAAVRTVLPMTEDAAANPAYPKNFRLLNILVAPIWYCSFSLTLEQGLICHSISNP
jgi:hypothetical protein